MAAIESELVGADKMSILLVQVKRLHYRLLRLPQDLDIAFLAYNIFSGLRTSHDE